MRARAPTSLENLLRTWLCGISRLASSLPRSLGKKPSSVGRSGRARDLLANPRPRYGFQAGRRSRRASSLALLVVAGCTTATPDVPDAAPRDLAAPEAGCVSYCLDDTDCGGLRCDRHSGPCGQCVQCLRDEDCGGGGQLCDPRSHSCHAGCSAQRGCGPDGGACELDAGLCFECLAEGDCGDPTRPRCDVGQRRCFACLPQSDNCDRTHFCQLVGSEYQCSFGCKGDADCGMGMRCDAMAHQCVGCLGDADCPPGKVCGANRCVAGCSDQHPCGPNVSCCGGQCVLEAVDVRNCGGCGVACKANWSCCGGACADPLVDPANCGGCGMPCVVAHGTPSCSFGGCGIAACDAGFDDCNRDLSDGCETKITTIANCGACRRQCVMPNAFPVCDNGACAIGACFQNFADCDGAGQNGCEIALMQDPKNCGKCGAMCAQGQQCINGICR